MTREWTRRERWAFLSEWLEGRGYQWCQWARIGTIDADNATLVLDTFGIPSTPATRQHLRRAVDAVSRNDA